MLFLGAGASAMFGKPTTGEFLQALHEYLDEDAKKFYNFLDSEIGFDDIEHVLQDLKEVRSFGETDMGRLAFPYTSRLRIQCAQDDFLSSSRKLEDQIKSLIRSYYKWSDDDDKDYKQKLELYRQIFLDLRSETDSVTVFTTNYDTIIEKYCSGSEMHTCVDGFTDKRSRSIWTGNFTKNVRWPVCLYKLHGSLGWERDKKHRIIKSSERDNRSDIEDVIIMPTHSPKKEEKDTPFLEMFKFMKKEFKKHNTCIVIGCSFRDQSINDVFRKFIRKRKTMVVISPTASKDLQNNLFKQKYRMIKRGSCKMYIDPKKGQGLVIAFDEKFEHDSAVKLVTKSMRAIKKIKMSY